ncbi:tripartite tricarboxylate transporter substrate binding protein [uncultured Desulfovibrio sp.]|uniref:tripartite tricarboxylate transporter substrate binding protein n=3 Tax=uncultured Desulfovibrio sp. TaxID=167968 RepID=UPI00266FDB32|nr:tripartite tricarboxylate transporter substrate binding protein [uncultured Desulfovibrio sp.]
MLRYIMILLLALGMSSASCLAGEYPDKSIRIIVPFNPGGGGEQAARLIEKEFKELTGQPLSFIYKPGGTGLIGMTELARQKADGYSIGIHSYPLLVLDGITGRARYTLDSFDFISLLCLEEVYLAVSADSPIKSAEELIAQARANPGKVNLGICEIMGPTHIPALRLKAENVPFNHVSIDGAGKVAPALLGGQVDAAIVPSGGVSGSIGKMKVLAVFSPERSKRFPDAPTLKELGFDINSAVGRYIAAPHGLKPEQRAYLESTFKTILARPDVAQRFENAGSIATWKSGDDLRKMFEAYIPEGQSMVDFYKKSQK